MNSPSHSGANPAFSQHQRAVLWVLWLTYGSFYFCRNNLGIALPGLSAELGYSKTQLGMVLMALKLAYGADICWCLFWLARCGVGQQEP